MTRPDQIAFCPGQFISLRTSGDYFPRRSFSIASSCAATNRFVLFIGLGTSADWAEALRIGDRLLFNGPMGYFQCDAKHSGDVVLAATGVGIAPVLSMIDLLIKREEPNGIYLYWGVKTDTDNLLRDKLDHWANCCDRFSYQIWVSDLLSHPTSQRGHISNKVIETARTLNMPVYYLCGSSAMVRDVSHGLEKAGIPRTRVRAECFYFSPVLLVNV